MYVLQIDDEWLITWIKTTSALNSEDWWIKVCRCKPSSSACKNQKEGEATFFVWYRFGWHDMGGEDWRRCQGMYLKSQYRLTNVDVLVVHFRTQVDFFRFDRLSRMFTCDFGVGRGEYELRCTCAVLAHTHTPRPPCAISLIPCTNVSWQEASM